MMQGHGHGQPCLGSSVPPVLALPLPHHWHQRSLQPSAWAVAGGNCWGQGGRQRQRPPGQGCLAVAETGLSIAVAMLWRRPREGEQGSDSQGHLAAAAYVLQAGRQAERWTGVMELS